METSLLVFFMIIVGIPVAGGFCFAAFQRWLQHKERLSQMKRSALQGAQVEQIEARLRVLEQIVTDGGVQTAAQIEALRDPAHRAQRIPMPSSDTAA